VTTCPACGHDLTKPAPDPLPKQPDCPCQGDCIACTNAYLLTSSIEDLTEQLRKYRGDQPIH
jgi:hypothetical protein